ncbi:hypothetical protein DIPPA_09264 [Diplonema papillatum]|nr:hypothetical protein DIPPA_09264 [Diplonema papillatum]
MATISRAWSGAVDASIAFGQDVTTADVIFKWRVALDSKDVIGPVFGAVAAGVGQLVEMAEDERVAMLGPAVFDLTLGIAGLFPEPTPGSLTGAALSAADFADTLESLKGLDFATDAVVKAGEAMADGVSEHLGETLLSLLKLDEAMNGIEDVSGTGSEAAELQQALNSFVREYNAFEGRNVREAMRAVAAVEALVGELCLFVGDRAAAVCATLADDLGVVASSAEQGVVGAYAAAGNMAEWARLQVQRTGIRKFDALVEIVRQSDLDGTRLALFDDVALATASFRILRHHQKLWLHAQSMQFCALQRYNHGGAMSTPCKDLMSGDKLTTAKTLNLVLSTGVRSVRRELGSGYYVAGLPTAPSMQNLGHVNLTALLRGEAARFQIPMDAEWQARYGWDTMISHGAAFVKSVKVQLPLTAPGASYHMAVTTDRTNRVYRGTEAVLEDTLLRTRHFYHKAACGQVDNGQPNAYGRCDTELPGSCSSYSSSFGDEKDTLPSVYSTFELQLTESKGIDLSNVNPGDLVLKVEAEVVLLRGRTESEVLLRERASASASIAQGCCNAGEHVVRWAGNALCEACSAGSVAAHGGAYCERP